jgi:hypothetical protein
MVLKIFIAAKIVYIKFLYISIEIFTAGTPGGWSPAS